MKPNIDQQQSAPTLILLAAGSGSRYGGAKQIDAIGPFGEWLMDYTVFDAIRLGFGKVVFVVSAEMQKMIHAHYAHILHAKIAFETVVQHIAQRSKPWGTGHAVLSALHVVNTDFAVLNADDFYGYESIEKIYSVLVSNHEKRKAFLVVYPVYQTLSVSGAVSRALCTTDETGNLLEIKEHPRIYWNQSGNIVSELDGYAVILDEQLPVSMNCWAFSFDFFEQLQQQFDLFLNKHSHDPFSEFFLPTAVQRAMVKGAITVELIPAKTHWFGLTYASDKTHAAAAIKKLHHQNKYPSPLWT